MVDRSLPGAPAAPAAPADGPRSSLHAAGIESRLYAYPGCEGLVVRYFVLHDAVPRAYRTAAEALAELRRRQADRRQT